MKHCLICCLLLLVACKTEPIESLDSLEPSQNISFTPMVDTTGVGTPYWSFPDMAAWEKWVYSMSNTSLHMREWNHREFGVAPFQSYESWYDSAHIHTYWPFAASISAQGYIAYADTLWKIGPLYSSYRTDTGWCHVPTLARSGVVTQSFVDTVVDDVGYRCVVSRVYQQDCWKRWQHIVLARSEVYIGGRWRIFPVEHWSYASHIDDNGEEIFPEVSDTWYPGVWMLSLPLHDVQGDIHVQITDHNHPLYARELHIRIE